MAAAADMIRRPVGESRRAVVAYDVDGFHPELGIVLEIEAGRGAANNADLARRPPAQPLLTAHTKACRTARQLLQAAALDAPEADGERQDHPQPQ